VLIIGELDRFHGIIVRIYPEKGRIHNIPHIHVYYNEYRHVSNPFELIKSFKTLLSL